MADEPDEKTHGEDNRTPDTALEALEEVLHLGIVPPVVQSFDPDLSPTIDPTEETGASEGRASEPDDSDGERG